MPLTHRAPARGTESFDLVRHKQGAADNPIHTVFGNGKGVTLDGSNRADDVDQRHAGPRGFTRAPSPIDSLADQTPC